MDYGGNERRRTKKDLKRKRLARGYKRGGQFRSQTVSETGELEVEVKEVISKTNKKGKRDKKKR